MKKINLTEQYLQAETDNDTEKANELIDQAYKLDTALGNEFKKLFNADLKSGLFFDPDAEVNLFFDLYNGTLSEQEIMDALSAGNIGKETAISLRSQMVSMRKDSYAKADAELRKQLSIPEPGAITPGFIETKKYRQYVKRSGELLKFYNDNPDATPNELIAYARSLEEKQKDQDLNEQDFNKESYKIYYLWMVLIKCQVVSGINILENFIMKNILLFKQTFYHLMTNQKYLYL